MSDATIRIGYTQPAPELTRFAPGAFDNAVGKEVPMMVNDQACRGTLVSAVVAENGRSVRLTLEVALSALAALPHDDQPISIL
jgi:hypothetical protein